MVFYYAFVLVYAGSKSCLWIYNRSWHLTHQWVNYLATSQLVNYISNTSVGELSSDFAVQDEAFSFNRFWHHEHSPIVFSNIHLYSIYLLPTYHTQKWEIF
ncbi:hypothetical protein VPH35_092306 [Triticum aestivum]